MPGLDVWFKDSLSNEQSQTIASIDCSNSNSNSICFLGGLFLDNTAPSSILETVCSTNNSISFSNSSHSTTSRRKPAVFGVFRRDIRVPGVIGGEFLCLSLSIKRNSELIQSSDEQRTGDKIRLRGRGGMNTTKHLWAGAAAAMVSRTVLAPLERLKLEYIVRGEQKNLFELITRIAASQGLRGFWKGNLVNILRTAPFKAINFCAFDTYRKELLRLSGNKETTNVERFIAGAAAGITASVLCLPLDTIRTKLVARGGEALGGVTGAFRHVIRTEGFFSLYKGLLPSIMSVAPSAAVFYGVYDILKSAYLHSPEGRKRIEHMKAMKQHGQDLNALDKLELGPIRTLLYGAISGACAEAATYPFEVVRRKLQLQVRATKLSALATFLNIVEQGGIPAVYAGLVPSLLQVLPSAAISYFVYEFMKIVLKAE